MAYILLIYGLHMAYIWLICGLDVGEIFWTFWENHTIRRFYVDFTLLHTNHGEYPPQPPALPFPNNGLSTGNPWIPTPRSHQETANSPWFSGVPIVAGLYIRTHSYIPRQTWMKFLWGCAMRSLSLAQASQRCGCSRPNFPEKNETWCFFFICSQLLEYEQTCGMMLAEKLKTWGLSNQILGM